jgi:hypothetical protein
MGVHHFFSSMPATHCRDVIMQVVQGYAKSNAIVFSALHYNCSYFECDLYGGVTLSTHPPTHTPNMSSWFPIYFPLRVSDWVVLPLVGCNVMLWKDIITMTIASIHPAGHQHHTSPLDSCMTHHLLMHCCSLCLPLLQEPMYVPAGAPVEVEMWRCCGTHKVWYEWSITAPVATPIHNPGGRSYYVGL